MLINLSQKCTLNEPNSALHTNIIRIEKINLEPDLYSTDKRAVVSRLQNRQPREGLRFKRYTEKYKVQHLDFPHKENSSVEDKMCFRVSKIKY